MKKGIENMFDFRSSEVNLCIGSAFGEAEQPNEG